MISNVKKTTKRIGLAGNAALEAMILVAVIGAVGAAGLSNYGTARKMAVSASVHNELIGAQNSFSACYGDLAQIASCDTLAKLGLVSDLNIQPYATLTQATTTAALTETFLTTARADACNAATGVAGTIVVVPTVTGAYAHVWASTYTGVDTRCKVSNAS